jgi:Acyl-CoA dehydrogenase, C-terminal domain
VSYPVAAWNCRPAPAARAAPSIYLEVYPIADFESRDRRDVLAIWGSPGQLATQVAAAGALLAQAAAVLDEVGRVPASAAEAARGSLAVAEAKAFASEAAAAVTSGLFDLTGASAADEKHDLSRHWRNSRTHASHDPASWKYHHIGNFLLNDVPPPNHGQL